MTQEHMQTNLNERAQVMTDTYQGRIFKQLRADVGDHLAFVT